jgi:ribonuclease HII
MTAVPTLELEQSLWRDFSFIIALDEVGRGAIAGPVAVGAVLLSADVGAVPAGIRDSKLITEAKRAGLAEQAAGWVSGSTVGWSSAAEVDAHGIMRALGFAASRAISELLTDADNTVVLLDGNYDYISLVHPQRVTVRTVVKGDRDCASIAAASLIAKVARDEGMRQAHQRHPEYGWDRNKGYASATHRAAIQEHGLSALHRATWSIV